MGVYELNDDRISKNEENKFFRNRHLIDIVVSLIFYFIIFLELNIQNFDAKKFEKFNR